MKVDRVRAFNRSTEGSASSGPELTAPVPGLASQRALRDLAQREDALRKLIDETPAGPRHRLLRHELRNVVANRMTAERRSS